MAAIILRELKEDEIDKIKRLDRSEEIFESYVYTGHVLTLKPTRETVLQFDASELKEIIERQRDIIIEGGCITGAFDNDELVGAASVERKKRGKESNYCKMDILYVSRDYRKMKVGYELLKESIKKGKEFGAQKLYISATPTKNTVDFYLKHGAVLTSELDKELFEAEPDDLHLELSI